MSSVPPPAQAPPAPAPPPLTYRLQLRAGLTLSGALAAVPYLDALGAGAAYLSPITVARPDSTHGYDCSDPTRIDPAVGDHEQLVRLSLALRERGMGLLLDVVPNHMAASATNPWWWDVLARGPSSPHASVFDIDWRPTGPSGRRQVLLPVLGRPYGEVLAAGEIRLADSPRGPEAIYYQRRFPLAPGSVDPADLAAAAQPLPAPRLHQVLEQQAYRLADWRVATERINYRRFFDISDLVSVRVEDPAVFAQTHALIASLARSGVVTGLRIDHIDGLWDPAGYLERLQRAITGDPQGGFWIVVEKILGPDEELPRGWPVAGTTGYELGRAIAALLVDAAGLTALDHLYHRFAGRPERFADLLIRQKARMLDELFAGEMRHRAEELFELADRDLVARDLSRRQLERALAAVTACFPVYRTYARPDGPLTAIDRGRVQAAVAAAAERQPDLDPQALDFVERALVSPGASRGRELLMRWQQLTGPLMAKGLEDTTLYQYNRLLALNMVGGEPNPPRSHLSPQAFHRHARTQAERWWGGLTATSTHDSKRSEDVRARLFVLAELPEAWQRALWRWHRDNQPHRGQVVQPDGRARTVPDPNQELFVYQTLLGAWPQDGAANPAELAHFRERLRGYLVKAAREAKVHTSWTHIDEAHEAALVAFADAITDPERAPGFLRDFRRLARRVALHGAVNSLAQVALKLAAPGVADFYQGTELWTLTLVNPDNRAPVDLAARARLLAELDARVAGRDRGRAARTAALCGELCRTWRDGRIKLWLTAAGLRARRADPDLFMRGDYLPAESRGDRADHLFGFARRRDRDWLVCAVPRRSARMGMGLPLGRRAWRDTGLALAAGAPAVWQCVLSGQTHRARHGQLAAADLFRHLPVALLRAREE